MSNIKAYIKVAAVEVQNNLVYRINYIFSMITILIPVTMGWYLWSNVYTQSTDTGRPFDLENMLLYSVVGIGLKFALSLDSANYVSGQIRSGNIILDLTKPISFICRLLAREVGNTATNILLKFFPVFFASVFLFKLNLKILEFYNILLFMLLFSFGFLIMFMIECIVGILSFWITQLWGVNFAKNQIIFILSGAFIPIWMFPDTWQSISLLTPLPYIFSLPLEALLGYMDGSELIQTMIIQCIWIVILFILVRLMWYVGIRNIVVHGG